MKRLGLVVLCMAAVGCTHMDAAYVKADRLTYEAVAPEYLKYVDADTNLSDVQKSRRKRTVETWALRIEKHKGD